MNTTEPQRETIASFFKNRKPFPGQGMASSTGSKKKGFPARTLITAPLPYTGIKRREPGQPGIWF